MKTNLVFMKIMPWHYWLRHPIKAYRYAKGMLALDKLEKKMAGKVIV